MDSGGWNLKGSIYAKRRQPVNGWSGLLFLAILKKEIFQNNGDVTRIGGL